MVLGISHQTATVDIREKLIFDVAAGVRAASWLVQEGIVTEAVLVSTCNRTELYCEGEPDRDPLRLIIGHLGQSYDKIEPFLYQYFDLAAVTHLMRVAVGLDSMVLGEGEILGQLKRAYAGAMEGGSVGKHLGRLFQTTFSVSKEARTNTGIGINPVSVAYAAAKLSRHIFADLSSVAVLFVGAGDLIRTMARHLVGMGVGKVMVANRSLANRQRLAEELQAESFGLEKIPEHLAKADIVITGTASGLPLLGKGMVETALRQRKRKPMFMVDLSVPRNIEVEVGELEDVYLYCIDDLQGIVAENKRCRQDAMEEAECIIHDAASQFMSWLQAQDSFRILCLFRRKFEEIRDQLLQESIRKLQLGEDPEGVLKRLAYHLTNRYLHEPTRRLREAGLEQEAAILTLTRDLFELNHEIIYSE